MDVLKSMNSCNLQEISKILLNIRKNFNSIQIAYILLINKIL